MHRLIILFALNGLVLSFLFGGVDQPRLHYAPDRVLLKFYEDTPQTSYWMVLMRAAPMAVRTIPGLNIHVLQVDPRTDIPALVRDLNRIPGVQYAGPDHCIYPAWEPDDPLYPSQPALPLIRCPAAWDIWRGALDFIVAILDTGVLRTHIDLAAKLLPGYDFGNDDPDPTDFHGHGTFVTGIAAAVTNNGEGIAGICPECRILPVKVFTDLGGGFESDLVDGIQWAVQQGAHVINMSLGATSPLPLVETAVNYAWNQGVVVVAAAGNANNTLPFYPAFYTNCIATGASMLDDTKSPVSTYGSWVEVAAPSGDVYSTRLTGQYGRNRAGFTSYAAPFVSGEAVLLYSMIANGPGDRNVANAQTVRNFIENNVDPVVPFNGMNWVAHGRIDLGAAVQAASTVQVQGQVSIENFVGNYNQLQLQIELREVGTTNVLASQTVTPAANGQFSATFTGYVGNHDLAFKTDRTLRRVVSNVRMRYPQVVVNPLLIPGDVDNNNLINNADLSAELSNFSRTGNRNTDLNGDGKVDDRDLSIGLSHHGLSGDS